jgi:hypothetical protein
MSAEDVEKLAKDILAQNLSDDVIYENSAVWTRGTML